VAQLKLNADWVVLSSQEQVDEGKRIVSRCLLPDEREKAFLEREPPQWCLERSGLIKSGRRCARRMTDALPALPNEDVRIHGEYWRISEQRELLVSGFWAVISRAYVALPTSSQAATVTKCDRLTSHSEDPLRIAAGVPFDSIDAPTALSACNEAVKDHPDEPRYLYLRGRAYARAASIAEKVKDEVAAKANNAAALTERR